MSTLDEDIKIFKSWLSCVERIPCVYTHFAVIDVETNSEIVNIVRPLLSSLILTARIDPKLLESLVRDLDWDLQGVRECLVDPLIPEREKIRRGEFGEVIVAGLLEWFHEYHIPVMKLRYKITSDQTLPATDVLALLLGNNGEIAEVCYTECKLRTTTNKSVAVQAAEQLEKDYKSRMPEILTFVVRQLNTQGSPLLKPFADYMKSRRTSTDQDGFRLALVFEKGVWHEDTLQNLEEGFGTLPKLIVHVVLIENLRQLTDELFADIGITEVYDD